MSKKFTYKGYTGQVDVDADSDILFGSVLQIKDVITFQGETVKEAEQEFHNSIDDYLEFCKEIGQEPEKPLPSKISFQTTPENHQKIKRAAKKEGKSMRVWMEDVLTKAANQTLN